jgi:S1-C subfamily serine protease
MRRWLLPGPQAAVVVALVLLAGCASSPRTSVTPLPEVRLKEISDLLSGGSYLKALGAIDENRRSSDPLPEAELAPLASRAASDLQTALRTAATGGDLATAMRLLDAAMALGRPELAGSWTQRSLLAGIAGAEETSGDKVLALLTRLKMLSLPDATDADYTAAAAAATAIGNAPVRRALAAAMKARGISIPADLAAGLDSPPSFARMISGTVTILVNRGIKVENGVGYPDRVIGSGFFIDPRGYIITNHHVVESEVDPKYEGYSRLYIRLSDSPAGERIPARVLGWDKVLDLALIKTEVTPPYIFGGYAAEQMQPGDRIYAIGSPAGLEKTITSGIVSATGRRLLQVGDSLQVDVPLNPGNSGGPLLNEMGDLIGIVFAGLQQYEGLNFAVPYTWVEKAIPALYKGGAVVHSWLGMAVAEGEKGLEVVYVVPDEPAAQAGIRVGDIVESLDGVPYKKLGDIQEAVLLHDPPTLVRVGILRDGKPVDLIACISSRPDNPIEVALSRDARDNVLYPLFGMQLDHVSTFLWKGNYIVRRVTRGSVADESGISVDDPLTIQDWQVDKDKGYATLQVVIKKKRAGFLESAIQISSYLETDNFI